MSNFSSRSARRFSRAALVALASLCALGLASCGGSGSDSDLAHVRLVNLVTDSSTISLDDDGTSLGTGAYGSVTAYAAAKGGSHSLSVSYLVPSNQTTSFTASFKTFGTALTQSLSGSEDYTVFAIGTIAAPQLIVVSGKNARDAVADNHFIYQFANAAPNAGPVTVTVTFPEGGIASPTTVGTLAVGQASDLTDVQLTSVASSSTLTTLTGTISMQFRNSAGALLLDSGPLQITEQTRVLFVAMDRLGPGSSPAQMLIVSGTAAAAGQILSASTDGAEFNFANISGDAGPLDLIAGSPLNIQYASNIGFGQQSAFNLLPPYSTGTIATPAGQHNSPLFVQQITPAANASYTMYAQGAMPTVASLLVGTDRRSVPTEARMRFLIAAPSRNGQPATDIYLVPSGVALDLTTTHVAASAAALPYLTPSGYFSVAPGAYDVHTNITGSSVGVLNTSISVSAGSVQTFVMADQPGGGLTLLPFDDTRH